MEGNVEMEDAFDSKKGDGVFVVGYEVDFDYEFDASKCFDFSREETEMEARVAEMWFQTARGHDPSPLVAKTSTGVDFLKDNINVSPKLKILDDTTHKTERGTILTEVDECYKGSN
ncbi:hypothetical protein ZOSMA_46G00180 [Zostera marina]|uniref:TPX2 central domain-containing protein n=1 Tax=Zostera marina TaxID=29655 RepID=A0A0K9NZW2_ZOSMR|nr:hypothetical protein ZOSMA_46G00180 [Zostera marina]